ncbi:MAG TPA: VOC family protein [Candidatus Saccharimonadales bacterium]|nr:VOC family protein [Candidatus Saccharimonadales bacterium]
MLKDAHVMVTYSISDIEKAKHFYSEILGLEVTSLGENMLSLNVKGSTVAMYLKKNHTPATYTILNFTVDDVKKTMNELKEKGVEFIHYKPEEISEVSPDKMKIDDDGMADFGGSFKIAFFNDPAGNNLAILQM